MTESKRQRFLELLLAETFSVLVTISSYLFLINHMSEELALVLVSCLIGAVALTAFRKGWFSIAISCLAAIVSVVSFGFSNFSFGADGSFIVASVHLYLAVCLGLCLIYDGHRTRFSVPSLFLESMVIWATISHLPRFL
ncbi:MAG: hypothetical protein V4690_02490 [Patescibacteria group bacterium]